MSQKLIWKKDERKIVKIVLSKLQLSKPESILDVGCNTGDYCQIFSRSIFKSVAGIDIDIKSTKEAKQHCPNAEFICADIRHLPFIYECFDVVFCKDVFHHLKNSRRNALEQLSLVGKHTLVIIEAKLLNPLLFAGFYFRGHRHLSDKNFKGLLSEHDEHKIRFFSTSGVYPFPGNRGKKIVNFFRNILFFIPSYNVAIVQVNESRTNA